MIDRKQEGARVRSSIARSKANGTPATLSLHEWTVSVDAFDERCAYCQGAFQVLEHIIPESIAGTVAGNCVPACFTCNVVKGDKLPDAFRKQFPPGTMERIERTLLAYGFRIPSPTTGVAPGCEFQAKRRLVLLRSLIARYGVNKLPDCIKPLLNERRSGVSLEWVARVSVEIAIEYMTAAIKPIAPTTKRKRPKK